MVKPAVLFAGRLIAYKGLSWFVKHVLPLVDPAISLLVAGPVWDKDELDTVMREPRAKYVGTLGQTELNELRSKVLACVMPNLPPEVSLQNEGFGLSALESPAVGTPVVATTCGGLTEAVVDGTTGFLVAPLDAEGFAAKLNVIYSWTAQERLAFSNKAREEIRTYFNWDRVAADYVSAIT